MSADSETIGKLAEINSSLSGTAMSVQRRTVLLRQAVGYLIDAAEPHGDGDYIVPGDSIEDLRELLTGCRGDAI
ncbi:MAG: hypothetical protein KKD01_01225 [Proteobacteria bacterium]|nr:hypothetical protein [Pseudomonadota bacterium]MBU1418275.1 hypothetical protein [Pseudomonadota bacterium]MBU1453321.1 hypothetical protein [Pseudomonadota bacterium]